MKATIPNDTRAGPTFEEFCRLIEAAPATDEPPAPGGLLDRMSDVGEADPGAVERVRAMVDADNARALAWLDEVDMLPPSVRPINRHDAMIMRRSVFLYDQAHKRKRA